MSSSDRPPKPRNSSKASYHHGDLRAALLAAVAEIIRERGAGEVSLREAARRAQVSHGAPAHHFGNKAGLLTAFAAQGFERLGAAIEAEVARARSADAAGLLAAAGRGYVRFALANPEHFSIMFRRSELDQRDPALTAAGDRAHARLTTAIQRCVSEGVLRRADVEAATAAAWSLAHGFAVLWIDGRLRSRGAGPDPE